MVIPFQKQFRIAQNVITYLVKADSRSKHCNKWLDIFQVEFHLSKEPKANQLNLKIYCSLYIL